MSKKAFVAAIAISLVLTSLLIGIHILKVAKAIDYSVGVPNPPPIVIQSPLNSTYNQNDVFLSFTIVGVVTLYPTYFLQDVYYICDWGKSSGYLLSNYNGFPPPKTDQFSTTLTGLGNGEHTLTVYAVGSVAYYTDSSKTAAGGYTIQITQTVNFSIETNPSPSPTYSPTPSPSPSQTLAVTPTPSPTLYMPSPFSLPPNQPSNQTNANWLYLVIVIVAIVVGLLVYFWKRG